MIMMPVKRIENVGKTFDSRWAGSGRRGCGHCGAVASAGRDAEDPRVQKLVSRGLDWIASTQSRLGHWSANDGRYPTAMTALAGMALLAEGSTTTQGKYATNIRWPSTTWSRAAGPTA